MNTNLTFLIVDEDADSRFLTRHSLKKIFHGCNVVEATTVNEGFAKTKETSPDAVLTDQRLGYEDGTKLIDRLRKTGVSCPVIMVTGSFDPALHERALAVGANGVFSSWHTEYLRYLRETLPR